ncbi:MAG: N-methyl-L-tryptophan oxidase [Pirellulales bacterium]
MASYDAIVLGTGGVGSAALFHLARRGAKVLGLDRFPPAHNRGSSHGQTRMIRQAYFEHPDYVPLVRRSYALWREMEALRGTRLYHEVGLLEIGPPDGLIVPGVLKAAAEHGLPVERLSPQQIQSRFPGFRLPDEAWVGLFERHAGYLRVEACVQAHLDEAARHGAELKTGIAVQEWRVAPGHVEVMTEQGVFMAEKLVISAGAWAGKLLTGLGLRLEIRRKPQYWYRAKVDDYRADRGGPAFLYETPQGLFYGFPQIDDRGVKIAEHSGGTTIDDPLRLNREVDPIDQARVAGFAARYMPGITAQLLHHAPCMYTMTSDEHFIVDRHPAHPRVAFAAGLSGHGFKFAPVLGEVLADLTLAGKTALPIGFLRLGRPGLA